ncbi:MAG: hypothetical protein MZW92_43485 [Comamonadaceae bacterium]|nr:hypothetical protein [Comamonadaceae bacterium]
MKPLNLFVATVAIWGTTWIAIKFQIDAVAPELGVALRFSIAAAVVLALCLARGIRTGAAVAHAGAAGGGSACSASPLQLPVRLPRRALHRLGAGGDRLRRPRRWLNMVLARLLLRHADVAAAWRSADCSAWSASPWSSGRSSPGLQGDRAAADRGCADCSARCWPVACRTSVVARAPGAPASTAGRRWAYAMAWGAATSWLAVAAGRPAAGAHWTWPFVAVAVLPGAGRLGARLRAYYALLGKVGPARAAYVGVMSTIVALLVSRPCSS